MRSNDSDRRAREFGLLLAAARGHTLGLAITHPEGDIIIDGALDRLTRARLLLIEERRDQAERATRRARTTEAQVNAKIGAVAQAIRDRKRKGR